MPDDRFCNLSLSPRSRVRSDRNTWRFRKDFFRTKHHKKEKSLMPTITTKDGTQIYYKDWGKGQPIVFSHGWPLTADDWDPQMLFFGQNGYRVIAHDRRGHGRSTQTWDGN